MRYKVPIFLAVTIGLFNQLPVSNAILYYSNFIFNAAGFNQISSFQQNVIIGFMNLVGTAFGMTLIDRLGRKTLLIVGSIGTSLCLAGVAFVFFTQTHLFALVWLLGAYIAFFAASQGAVIWVYIAEVFPNRVRAKGQSLGSSSHWVMNAIVSLIFPIVAKISGGAPLAFFAGMMILQLIIVLLAYPETKNMSLEQLQHKLGITY